MLVELMVENYAVIEKLRVRFHAGFNVLSGETGSGKSIVVDALGLLFGGRASGEMVRTGAERARISGIFEIPSPPAASSPPASCAIWRPCSATSMASMTSSACSKTASSWR
jgi:DNA repair protein RecN (Recombination protein N)